MNKIILLVGGESVEPKQITLRSPTDSEHQRLGLLVQRVVDRCPGCSEVIPVIAHKVLNMSYLATHEKTTPQGPVVCGYGGEFLSEHQIPA